MKQHFKPNAKRKIPNAIKNKIMAEFIELRTSAKEQAEKYGYSYESINRLHTTALEKYSENERIQKLIEQKKR